MTKRVAVRLLLIFCCIGAGLIAGAKASDNHLAAAKEALTRSICREVYWYGARYRLGTSLRLEVKFEGEMFYAWIDDLLISKHERMSYFYEGRIKEGKAAVISIRGHNMALELPLTSSVYIERRKFEKDAVNATLTLPARCLLHIDPSTPEKKRMLETVVKTMEKELSSYVRLGIASYSRKATIIIADFNVDYPQTHVLVDQPEQLYMFTVTLHDREDYDSDKYERDGAYPLVARRIDDLQIEFLTRIRKNGIVRNIVVTAQKRG